MIREECPNPIFKRERIKNLNGKWEFEICDGKNLTIFDNLSCSIQVPFCPESKLSGIENKDFMKKLLYRKKFDISENDLLGRVILNFGAVDFIAKVYINKEYVGEHIGGYLSFAFDITQFLKVGENTIDVDVFDDTRDRSIPSGKQSERYDNYFCYYTRTTGIWQSVWLEFVPKSYIISSKITPDVDNSCIHFESLICGNGTLEIDLSFGGKLLSKDTFKIENDAETILYKCKVDVKEKLELWNVLDSKLYDIELKLKSQNSRQQDEVQTYCGFRKVELKDKNLYINGKKVFLKQVLDQGFYKEGIYTAPTVEDIYKDIDLSIEFGFNGLRPHEKVFEKQYLYYADKMGVLLLGEYANWNCNFIKSNKKGVERLSREVLSQVNRDFNHPSIIGWCPLNETWGLFNNKNDYISQKKLVDSIKEIDNTRFVIGASGGDSYVGDVFDVHSYAHDGEKLKKILNGKKTYIEFAVMLTARDKKKLITHKNSKHLPKFLSEYGGLTFMEEGKTWGYAKAFNNSDEVVDKFIELTKSAYEEGVMGVCYTQLYDVFQEQNGLVKFDRTHKFSESQVLRIRDFLNSLK